MTPALVRPFDFILEPDELFRPDPSGLRPYRLLTSSNLSNEGGRLVLQARQQARPPLAGEDGSFGGFSLVRGVAVWEDTIFFADPDRRRLLYWRSCQEGPRLFPALNAPPDETPPDCPPGPAQPGIPGQREVHTPLALALSARHDLIVVDRDYQRLVLFTLPGYALRRIIESPSRLPAGWPARPAWHPVDAATGPRGAFYILDANGFIWKLDAQYRLDPYYQGVIPVEMVPERIAVDAAGRAYVIVALADRRMVITLDRYGWLVTEEIDQGGAPVSRPYEITGLGQRVDPNDPQSPPLKDVLTPTRLGLVGRSLLLLAAPCDRPGKQPVETGLTLDEDGKLVMEGNQPGPYVMFVPPNLTFQQEGTLFIELTGQKVGNPWHRVALEAQLPERTGLLLYSRTSDQPLPGLQPTDVEGPDWATSPDNPLEWLVQSLPGKYLYLGLRLIGPGDRTPSIDRLYVYRQRQSSLDFLPATYQADPTSRSVLDRLLSLYDTIYGEIETAQDDFSFRLDVASTPPEFLTWLASWFGLLIEAGWSETQRRKVLGSIMLLYHWQGTRQGIELLIRLHTGLQPRIIENYRAAGHLALETWLKPPADDLRGQQEPGAHFTILLPAQALVDPDQVASLRRLLDAYNPAHTHYTLRGLPTAGFHIYDGDQKPGVMVGVDTRLSDMPPWQLPLDTIPERRLGVSTLLPGRRLPSSAFQIGTTRLVRRQPDRCPSLPCNPSKEK